VLSFSDSGKYKALKPQILPLLEKKGPQIIFIKREGWFYTVTSRPVPADMDDGATAAKAFLDDCKEGKIVLSSVFTRLSNEELAQIPMIANRIKAKGLSL